MIENHMVLPRADDNRQDMTLAEEQERERWITERASQILADPETLNALLRDYDIVCEDRFPGLLSAICVMRGTTLAYKACAHMIEFLREFAERQAEDEWEKEHVR
jgi:hypothetical protein